MHSSFLSILGLIVSFWLPLGVSAAAISSKNPLQEAESSVAPRASSATLSGSATFYGGNLAGGACSFSTYQLPAGIYGTATANWDNSAHCGACVSVKGPNQNSITAMIVDQCPGCGLNHLDLFPDAFAKLADPSKGIIPITWSYIPCPFSTPLQLHDKSGVSQYWFSMQVVGANRAVTSLEVSTNGGSSWTAAQRQSYNFFQLNGGTPGSTAVDVRLTSDVGQKLVVNNVPVASDAVFTAPSNFS